VSLDVDVLALARFEPLAIQLAFVGNETIEGDVEQVDGVGEDVPCAPTRWSPMTSLHLWDQIPLVVKLQWLRYAQKVAMFAKIVEK
jgi:hypothetical protein